MADGPVLIITGASSGIGAETARQAAQAGYRLALGARREEELEALADELGGAERAIAVRCDVTEWPDCEALAAATIDAFGGFDAVFANAGFGASRGFLEESPEHWRSMILTNVLGVAQTIRATLPHRGMAADDYCLVEFRSSLSAAGFWEEDGRIWAPDGTLLAQSRQLALAPPG